MWVNDCVVVIATFAFRVALVSGLLRPIFDKGPVDLEACVILHLSPQFTLEAGDPDQVHQIMRVTLIHYSPIWEVVLPGLFSDARLQRTLDSISSQIIRTIIQENLQERPSLFDAKFREPLKIRSIHSVSSPDTAQGHCSNWPSANRPSYPSDDVQLRVLAPDLAQHAHDLAHGRVGLDGL